MDEQRLGAGLRALRVHARRTQLEVADAANVSRGTVSRIERGHLREVSLTAVAAVASEQGLAGRVRPVALRNAGPIVVEAG